MPTSAFFAVLRDVSKLAATAADDLATQAVKLTSAADDIATLTGKAAAKTAGVAGDDLAVGAGQVSGVAPNRELPALWRIIKGSAFNKAWLTVVLLILSAVLPQAITVALVLGALYLAYEGGEGLLERFHPASVDQDFEPLSEDDKVKGAIRTDLVLSLEILVIAAASIGDVTWQYRAVVLGLVSVIMTVGVYGLIGLIIRLDDMGLSLAKSSGGWRSSVGRVMVKSAPVILRVLSPIGMFAMFAVAGGIFSHQLHLEFAHWTISLLADVALAVVTGLVLAGSHLAIHHLRHRKSAHA